MSVSTDPPQGLEAARVAADRCHDEKCEAEYVVGAAAWTECGCKYRKTEHVLDEVAAERRRQDAKWGEQNHVDGTGPLTRPLQPFGDKLYNAIDTSAALLTVAATAICQANGTPESPDTWTAILLEEVFEALAEDDPQRLRAELVQVAAVAAQWVEAIDRRGVQA